MLESEENPKPAPKVEELQAKLAILQGKMASSKEQVVRDALQAKILEIAAELGPEIAAQAAQEPHAAKKNRLDENIPLPEPPTPAEQLQADDLIRQARVAKMRGHVQAATDLIQQASRVAPGSVTVLEMLGDEFMERKLMGDARRTYQMAHRLDPRNVSVERKFAHTVLRTSAGMTIQNALASGLDSPFMNANDTMANAKFAIFLSIIVPGSGQMVLGETIKGLVLLGCYILSIVAFRLVAHSGSAALTLLPILGMLVVVVIAAQGCASKAKQDPTPGRHFEKPVPPVNLPFE